MDITPKDKAAVMAAFRSAQADLGYPPGIGELSLYLPEWKGPKIRTVIDCLVLDKKLWRRPIGVYRCWRLPEDVNKKLVYK